jgi:hypothetical protein
MNKPYNILTDYKPSGNTICDSLAICIMEHRKKRIAIKTIHLKDPYYSKFRAWVEYEYRKVEGVPYPEGAPLSFDKVNIDLASKLQVNPVSVETYDDYNQNNHKKELILN